MLGGSRLYTVLTKEAHCRAVSHRQIVKSSVCGLIREYVLQITFDRLLNNVVSNPYKTLRKDLGEFVKKNICKRIKNSIPVHEKYSPRGGI